MTGTARRYRLRSCGVAAKLIDGEAIILNAENGRYHCIDGPGAVAWALLAGSHSIEEASAEVAARWGVDPDRVCADVELLASKLVDQALLVADGGASAVHVDLDGAGEVGEYAPPELITFTDIEELIALDPPVPLSGELTWKADPDA